MKLRNKHAWPEHKFEAYAHQEETLKKVVIHGNTDAPSLIAAVDTTYGHAGEIAYAAALVMTYPGLEEVERAYHHLPASFPYHPGLFYYREGPAIVEVLSRLDSDADLIMVGAHGIAHPRGCGLACQLGVVFDKPSLGCARKLLAGKHYPVESAKGSFQPIMYQKKAVGVAYRSKKKVKPVFISPGHLCNLEYAQNVVVRCLRGFRLPEPLRVAHLLANKHKRYIENGQNYRDLQRV